MNVHIQRRLRTSAIPPRSSSRKAAGRSPARGEGGEPMRISRSALTTNVAAVDRDRRAGAERDDQQPAQHRARARARRSGPAPSARWPAGAAPARRTGGPARPRRGGSRPRRRRRAPPARSASTARPRRRAAAAATPNCTAARPDVGHEHDALAGQPVGPDARREHQHGQRERLRGQHEAQLPGGAVELVQDRERQRHREQGVADERDPCPASRSRRRRFRRAGRAAASCEVTGGTVRTARQPANAATSTVAVGPAGTIYV